jgi:hypothetical protein
VAHTIADNETVETNPSNEKYFLIGSCSQGRFPKDNECCLVYKNRS